MHGMPEYYLAIATIIPLLLLNYFLGVDALKRVEELERKKPRRYSGTLVVLGRLGPIFVLSGSIAGEWASLRALFTHHPAGWHANVSVIGLICILVAGFLHLSVVLVLGPRKVRTLRSRLGRRRQ
jgi:hypothetical protein